QMTQRMYPRQPDRKQAAGRGILTGDVVNIADVQEDPEYATDLAVAGGWRSILNVPMLREGKPIGTIGVIRGQAGRFSDAQVELLRTFADQAVIAIENVRLFTELQEKNRALTQAHAQATEALEQQTATAEALRVISTSPSTAQPVLDIMAASAARLCDAYDCEIYRVDGDVLRLVAHHGPSPSGPVGQFVVPMVRGTIGGRSVLERRTIHVPDFQAAAEEFPEGYALAAGTQHPTQLGAPLLREGRALGVIGVRRSEVRPFTDSQITLLQTFADQAVIAIENVRLFTELQARTVELTQSVGELKALAEVGRAVSSTLDLQAVLDTIVARAVQLSGTGGGFIYEYDDPTQEFRLRATHQVESELAKGVGVEALGLGEGATGRAAAMRAPVQITDTLDERQYPLTRVRRILARLGYRSVLAVPLLLEQRVLGSLVVQRRESGTFAPEAVNLLQTFATQSALAIQNARLFREIETKSTPPEVASQHKSEFPAKMSHELRTPLNAIIGFSEVLGDRMFGELNEKQEEYLKDIHASGTHLLSLINDILDLSKIEAGRMELELTDFHLPSAIDSALTLVRERAGRRSIALHTNIDNRLGQIQA